nr:toll/interleukin-1 receptor domain-containing protein [Deltaproteobacteria bacterium]
MDGIREMLVAQLQAARCRLQYTALSTTSHGRQMQAFDPKLASQLHDALDEYDLITTSMAVPYCMDLSVLRVPIVVPMTTATGVRADVIGPASARLRSALSQASEKEGRVSSVRDKAMNEARSASPISRLEKALHLCLASDRIGDVMPMLQQLASEHRLSDVFSLLKPQEVEGVARALGSAATHDGILIALGLYSGSDRGHGDVDRVLAAKVRTDGFDVFMAHNSMDREAVLEVSRQLRRKGIHPWVDIEQVPPGQWFQDVIQQVIPRVGAAAIFLGNNGIGRWQALELRAFVGQCVERSLPVIPVLLPGVAEIPVDLVFLRELRSVKFVAALDDAESLARLHWDHGLTR